MSRRKRRKPSAAGVEAGQRVLDAFDLAVMREMLAEITGTGTVIDRVKLMPPPPPRTDSWFVEQEAKKTPPAAMRRDADQTYVDLVRWRFVRQAHADGLPWLKAYEAARDKLKACGPPFAGSKWAMRTSHHTIQRLRKATGTTKQS
jgi:hypothetical protein